MNVEGYIRKIANEKEIQLIGSYNPNIYSLSSNDFSDGYHLTSDATGKVFKAHSK
jgi:hypothetical protein